MSSGGGSGGRVEGVAKSPTGGAVTGTFTGALIGSPGWLDIQVNGLVGVDFNRPGLDSAALERAVKALWSSGVTRFLPTVITGLEEHMRACMQALAAAADGSETAAKAVAGVHMEGPFISPVDGARGAHPLEAVRPPDAGMFERLQRASGGRIRLLTLAPEQPGSADFIRFVTGQGVRVALAHSLANADQIAAAVEAGATLSTHLGNGIPATINRHHNPLWEQLADDRLSASVIFDGHHLPPPLIKVIHRVKAGRLIITSDAVALAGMPPGRYHDQLGGSVELGANGRLTLLGTEYLAGSASLLLDGVNTALKHLPVEVGEVLEMVSTAPADLLGLPARDDRLLLRLHESQGGRRVSVEEVVVDGVTVHRSGAGASA